jgi:cytosine/adenosine deaminase-related metal-dependent hydrolase
MAIDQKYKIVNAWICQVQDNEIIPTFGDIYFSDGIIDKIEPKIFELPLAKIEESENIFDAQGRVLTLPLVNFHDHIYSRLAKGLPLNNPMDSFQNILINLWWKLDLELDIEMISASAKMAAIESIKNGVTYIFDHHSSPTNTINSLETIKKELQNFGLRGVLCFETSDRNGKAKTLEAIKENINFYKELTDSDFKSLFGLHASFTVEDETLNTIYELTGSANIGIHIHVSEDVSDNEISLEKYNASPIQRLDKAKLLNDKTIIAHGLHIAKADFNFIIQNQCAVAYNLDSNLNNAVGLPEFSNVPKDIPILIGTDGMHANIAKSLKQFFLLNRLKGESFDDAFNSFVNLYFSQLKFVKKYFKDFPNLLEGDRADLIVWDYIPPTPITKENFWGHYIYGIIENRVQSVVQHGKYLMKDYKLINIDETKISEDIFIQGVNLYKKFAED